MILGRELRGQLLDRELEASSALLVPLRSNPRGLE